MEANCFIIYEFMQISLNGNERKCKKHSCLLFGSVCALDQGSGQFYENELKNSAQTLISLKYFSNHFRVLCSYVSTSFHLVRIVGTSTYDMSRLFVYNFMKYSHRCGLHQRLSEFINASFVMCGALGSLKSTKPSHFAQQSIFCFVEKLSNESELHIESILVFMFYRHISRECQVSHNNIK